MPILPFTRYRRRRRRHEPSDDDDFRSYLPSVLSADPDGNEIFLLSSLAHLFAKRVGEREMCTTHFLSLAFGSSQWPTLSLSPVCSNRHTNRHGWQTRGSRQHTHIHLDETQLPYLYCMCVCVCDIHGRFFFFCFNWTSTTTAAADRLWLLKRRENRTLEEHSPHTHTTTLHLRRSYHHRSLQWSSASKSAVPLSPQSQRC